ncbi:MAG TPA: twin-arginine translocase subunit TatC [Ktedonobacterales bacterium]|nr:twin-arginine translocase subunit TatC [Ktedonobacterales bacterium]
MAASEMGSDIQLQQLEAGLGDNPENDAEAEGTMTLIEHLEELRRRLFKALLAILVGSIIGFIFWQPILNFLLTPLPKVANALPGQGHLLIQKEIGEAFVIALKLSIAAGIALASPIVMYQVWGFIAPGLTRKEKKHAVPFMFLGGGLFLTGLGVGFLTLRYPITWLLGFGSQNFTLLLDANSYFTFVAFFLLAFGIVFELPLVLAFLSIAGIVNSHVLRAKRMYILFGLWVLSCFITPGADPYSPIIIGVSLTVLFELSVILMRILGK